MAGYQPLHIKAYETGLVQSREEFILPNDAYPVLENAYVWRERIKRKKGCELLGRLRRILTGQALGNTDGSGDFTGNIISALSLEASSTIEVGSVSITDGTNVFTDNSLGVLVGAPGGSGTINYTTGAITITGGAATQPLVLAVNYYPNLPVMGLLSEELTSINNEKMIAFDTKYAYEYVSGFQEFIPGTTWTGTDYNFFWSTNYWIGDNNKKIFWVTNFSGLTGDPIRYTNGSTGSWVNFAPQINAAGDTLNQCLAMLPFRGRMVTFNTFEGPNLAGSTQFRQRIRWAAIGNPFTVASPGVVTVVSANAWRDDIRGKGGFLDIPTAEDIVSVGFVRDNLVIYCERSTWQLRYTGRSIAPFQIEKVNTELGAESTFSAIQFDTTLVGIGDKGIVSCDSYQSSRIDIKIPDLVFQFTNTAQGPQRVYGVRNFVLRLAYWTYPYTPGDGVSVTYPNRRLVYNYENDSWAIFTDSFTCFGTYQPQTARRWIDYTVSERDEWERQNYPWIDFPALSPNIVAGNQQGFVEYLDRLTTNDTSLYIYGITGGATAVSLNVPNHNMQTGYIIQISQIPAGTPFATSLNDKIFFVTVTDSANFTLWKYSALTGQYSDPQIDASAIYVGGGLISIRDNFSIVSKKFNFLDEGQNIQMGFIDVLMDATESGAVSLNVYLDYNDNEAINILPQNQDPSTALPDTFFNSVVPTTTANALNLTGSKYWQRVFCPVRGAFITLEWTLNNEQMQNICQESDVQIDSQILWLRKAGRQLPVGV